MARENPIWGEERIADELRLKLGIRLSPRTVGKYLKADRPRGGRGDQQWSTFVRNHAKAIVAVDFFQSVTASFEVQYVFVVMEVGSRRILHTNVTDHPTAEWTTQQLREVLVFDHPYQYLIHDRDAIFSAQVDWDLEGLRRARLEDASSLSDGQRLLRARHRNDPARVLRLFDCPHLGWFKPSPLGDLEIGPLRYKVSGASSGRGAGQYFAGHFPRISVR